MTESTRAFYGGEPMTEKMTLGEAAKLGIRTLRRDPWAPRGRMTMDLVERDGKFVGHGPWVTVEDGATDFGDLEPQRVLVFQMGPPGAVWEEWSS